jgi:hypothetical protein
MVISLASSAALSFARFVCSTLKVLVSDVGGDGELLSSLLSLLSLSP